MGETRELREKLEEAQAELRRAREHLEKLKAYQAREQESLRQVLEVARREVAGLRSRLQELEAGASAPMLAGSGGVLELEPVERSEESTTALVALARIPPSLANALPVLSRVLNLPPADVRLRLSAMLPAVVARLPLAQAQALRAELRAEGFLAVSCVVPPREPARWVMVKRFALEAQGLSVEGALGEDMQVRYAELRLLIKGRRVAGPAESSRGDELMHRFSSIGQDAQWNSPSRREEVENFLWVLGKGTRLAFSQPTHFNGLGALRAPSVFENLQRLAGELHQRAPHAVVDGRFLAMTHFSLPLVDEDRSHELMAELLFQAVEEGLWT